MSDYETSGLLTDERIAEKWRAACEPERPTVDLVAGFARAIEDAARAPLLAEIERERDARRAAQEQVEKLQAEVARLEPMRQRADELDALHNNLHITQTALTLAQAERDAALKKAQPVRQPLTGLVDEIRRLPTVKAPEIDGEESDGTPRYWRSRPYVSLTQLERLLRAHGIGQEGGAA